MSNSALRGPGEVAQDQAGPDLARTYSRLKEMLGVGFVPTVHRMLGVHETYLAAVTESIGDLIAGERGRNFANQAREMGARAALSFPQVSISAGSDSGAIHALFDRYNRANPLNLLFTRALLPELSDHVGEVMEPRPDRPRSFADSQAVIADIEVAHGGFVKPGLWRELAEYPEVLSESWLAVSPLADLPAFHDACSGLSDAADSAAAGFVAPVPRELGLSEEDAASIETILSWFTRGISTMVVEIEYLRHITTRKRAANEPEQGE